MRSLREIQRQFHAALAADDAGAMPWILATRVPGTARIAVYRNNVRESARKTLAASYPVVARLVGELCFRNLSWSYLQGHPSRSGDLGAFGAAFPRLLDSVYGGTEFDYLAAVAELEWARVESEAAPAARQLDTTALAGIRESDYPGLRFHLHPSLRLVASRYPVFSIWNAHERDTVAAVDLDAGGECGLVYRSGAEIVVRRVETGTFAFCRRLGVGGSLYDAQCEAEAAARAFEPADALALLYQARLLTGIDSHHVLHANSCKEESRQ